jgi:tetratricopeptide (TPR) repeat protein
MKTQLFILLFIVVLTSTAAAQSPTIAELFREGKQLLHQGDMQNDQQLLMKSLGIFERILSADPDNQYAAYHRAHAEYQLALIGMTQKNDELFDQYVKSVCEHLDQMIEAKPFWPEPQSLLSMVYGIRISHNWINAPVLGPNAMSLAKKAVELDSTNPRSWMMLGSMKLNTPEFFGGNPQEALEAFQRADSLFAHVHIVDSCAPDWGQVENLAWLGQVYVKRKQYNDARTAFQKALSIEPTYGWVKFQLLPKLEKNMATQK